MVRYILKGVLYMVLVMLIVTTLTFFLVHSIPGDPFSAMIQDLPEETRVLYMEKYGFDQPLIVQYVCFMKQLFSGDLGSSLRYPGRTVAEIAASFAPVSAQVGGLALAIGFVVGTNLGITAALHASALQLYQTLEHRIFTLVRAMTFSGAACAQILLNHIQVGHYLLLAVTDNLV